MHLDPVSEANLCYSIVATKSLYECFYCGVLAERRTATSNWKYCSSTTTYILQAEKFPWSFEMFEYTLRGCIVQII